MDNLELIVDEPINREDFDFVSLDEKIFDHKFAGKPRSFFADALLRFTKNKVNVVAFGIAALFIILSIFVPLLTTKDFTSSLVNGVQNLPPRIPLLEYIGLADGTTYINDITADLTHYDESTGLYYPFENDFASEFIKKGTLKNKRTLGSTKSEFFLHGTNQLVIEKFSKFTVISKEKIDFVIDEKIAIKIKDISADTQLNIYISTKDVDTLNDILIGTINSTNALLEQDIVFTIPASLNANLKFEYVDLDFDEDVRKAVSLIDVAIGSDLQNPKKYYEGYNLSIFNSITIPEQGGMYIRFEAEYISCSFRFYIYNKVFKNQTVTWPRSQVLEMFDEYPEMLAEFENAGFSIYGTGLQPDHYVFEGNFPIVEIISQTSSIFVDGQPYYSYVVVVRGTYLNGFDSLPYFLFGTDAQGRDMFAEIWLSLRTSLLLGVIVTAINVIIGIIYGAIEGYYGGKVDFVMERIADYIASFPGLTILSIVFLYTGPGLALILIYLTYDGWIGTAGTTRIQFYRYRGREYVLASKTLGASDARLIFKHILPNGIGIIITRSVLSIPSMIFVEASLSFLGFGIGHGVTLNFGLFKLPGLSLGVILNDGFNNLLVPGLFYQVLVPSILIIILMISFNMFGNALRDAVNPTLKGSE